MAFLTENQWYLVTFRQTNDAAWLALSSYPQIPAPLLELIVAGNPVLVYVTSSSSGSFSFYGGGADGFDESVLTTIPAPETNHVTTSDSGDVTDNVVITAGGISTWYTCSSGLIMKYDNAEASALKSFLP